MKLIYPAAERNSSIFGVIHDAHLVIGHDGRNQIIKET